MSSDDISVEMIKECLERSGYLFESKLVRSLTEQGYFVEPNQVIRDPRTGKSREIDLIAEYFDYKAERKGVSVRTLFVVEAKNNKFPFILTTERPNSPGADFESYIKYVCTPGANPFIDQLDLYEEKGANWDNLYSQYCGLTRKGNSGELMASHSEDMYGSLLKLSEYIENDINLWRSRDEDRYWRLVFWQPMLVLSGSLLAVHVTGSGETELQQISMGRLEFHWHVDDQLRTTVIEVLTEQCFFERLRVIREKDDELEGMLHEVYQQHRNPGAV
ncbi:MAG: hypothetical protein LZF86_190595 [Nitrospira sp.]|nr:MAG: hypothetical protein LZF86_190595 [Nitrospira sp.]